jgi:hypothetical protein
MTPILPAETALRAHVRPSSHGSVIVTVVMAGAHGKLNR